MDLHRLLRPEPPWLHLLVAPESPDFQALAGLAGSAPGGVVTRVIRGHKARTKAALFDEFAAALQFPDYFGENWDAFDECLNDLRWLPGDGYILLIYQSNRLLEGAPSDQLQLFLNILEDAGREWSKPVSDQWPHPPKPFHVILVCPKEDEACLRDKLRAANVSFDVLHR
jgi:hypothetical protein